jgi:hypothetical protein
MKDWRAMVQGYDLKKGDSCRIDGASKKFGGYCSKPISRVGIKGRRMVRIELVVNDDSARGVDGPP